ncbi:hypothetical protein BDZ91DRAFT_851879 [Kalaharituber pfeilii]|nr:hypothetical protein BDZ91DRAFT_851879 [Kalaharituber pfeilii]
MSLYMGTRATVNDAELTAMAEVLGAGDGELLIISDSKVAISRLQKIAEGMPTPVGPANAVRRTWEGRIARGGLGVAVMWVKGRWGIKGNEAADKAARVGTFMQYQDEIVTEAGMRQHAKAQRAEERNRLELSYRPLQWLGHEARQGGWARVQVVRGRGGDDDTRMGQMQGMEKEMARRTGGATSPTRAGRMRRGLAGGADATDGKLRMGLAEFDPLGSQKVFSPQEIGRVTTIASHLPDRHCSEQKVVDPNLRGGSLITRRGGSISGDLEHVTAEAKESNQDSPGPIGSQGGWRSWRWMVLEAGNSRKVRRVPWVRTKATVWDDEVSGMRGALEAADGKPKVLLLAESQVAISIVKRAGNIGKASPVDLVTVSAIAAKCRCNLGQRLELDLCIEAV